MPDKSADGIGVIDVATRKRTGLLRVGSDPEQFAITRDGNHIVVSNEDVAQASVYDLTTGSVVGMFSVSEEPEGVALNPANGEAYVTCEGDGRVFPIDGMVEKPKPGTEPSNLTILGRYILQPEIFDILSAKETGAGGEIQITDAMIRLAKTRPFYAFRFDGTIYDCGTRIGFLAANVAYALARPDLAPVLRAELKKLL